RKATIVDKLDVETAMGCSGHEHTPLHALRDVPSRLPAHGGVKCEDEPPPSRIGCRRQFCRSVEERINVQFSAGCRRNRATLFRWLPHLGSPRMCFPTYRSYWRGATASVNLACKDAEFAWAANRQRPGPRLLSRFRICRLPRVLLELAPPTPSKQAAP